MPVEPAPLPSPHFTISVDLTVDAAESADATTKLSALPAKPGVFALEDGEGRTLALAITANLRRMVKSKLQPVENASGPTRRVDYASLTRRVLALRVGSAFEADWAYLQLARRRLPSTYRGLLDRWQAWFVQCDPASAFPQWTKTIHPDTQSPTSTICLGPFPEKHAAGRYIELLQDAFDLCRYHHLLVQAPNATACVYKEMGRCPAPCDGSVSMSEYRKRIDETVEFGCTSIDTWRSAIAAKRQVASERLQFEHAQHLQNLLDRTASATKSEFALVDRLERFAFVAIMPGEMSRVRSRCTAKIFLIRGGWIQPIGQLPLVADCNEIDRVLHEVHSCTSPQPVDFSHAGLENIGMTCWHLFRPRNVKGGGILLRIDGELNADAVEKALRQLNRQSQSTPSHESSILDIDTENLAATGDQA